MGHGRRPSDGECLGQDPGGDERACSRGSPAGSRGGLSCGRGFGTVLKLFASACLLGLCLPPASTLLVAVPHLGAALRPSPAPTRPLARRGGDPRLRSRRSSGLAGVVCSGPPSWVPWPGSNKPFIETERDTLLKREKCKLCSGTGKTACRRCRGKGYISGSSRPLRFGNETVRENERVVADSTGLVRAVTVAECDCLGTGLSECMLCCGTGKRLDDDPFSEEARANARKRIGFDEKDEGDDVHRYTGGRR